MGAKGSCRSPGGGGCPFLYAPWMLPGCSPASPFLLHLWQIFNQSGQKLDFICSPWCFLGEFGDNKVQNTNIFLKSKKEDRCGGGRLPAFHRVHRLQVVQGFEASGVLLGVSPPFLPAFCPLFCFACLGLLANMALFRVLMAFLARFMGFVWVCLAWVLCVACGAFVRVSG